MNKRCSGLLLHPVSLPSPYGIGTLGSAARDFIHFLSNAGQHIWQVLPLNPTGYGDSPYNALSAFAGNPLLIDLDSLIHLGDLLPQDLAGVPPSNGAVDYARVHANRQLLFRKAFERFSCRTDNEERREAFSIFRKRHSEWLTDFARYMVLRELYGEKSWSDWPTPIKLREAEGLKGLDETRSHQILFHQYLQFVFYEQWQEIKSYAAQHNILILGDMPIFVAYDSADVWAHRELFQLDEQGRPVAVAGVPPDYFSASGQLWGNPLYNWDTLVENKFKWWLDRFRQQLQLVDIVRVDHFRGFQACWSVPAGERTAVNGHWESVPGEKLFEALCSAYPNPPVIAEDLGVITPEVVALRDRFGFPGMKILQFAFDSGPDNPYLPHNHVPHCVVYTGTHDNNTTVGWWHTLDKHVRQAVRDYLGKSRPDIPWDLIELAMASIAELCIFPCQDILALDQSARFNRPGSATGNWRWRLSPHDLDKPLAEQLLRMVEKHKRLALPD